MARHRPLPTKLPAEAKRCRCERPWPDEETCGKCGRLLRGVAVEPTAADSLWEILHLGRDN